MGGTTATGTHDGANERSSAAAPPLESSLRERFDAGDLRAVATLAIDGYGGEIGSYLAAVLRDHERARDVLADTLVEMWRDLPRFRWEASLRTWLYTLARHRLAAHLSRDVRERTVASHAGEAEIEARARTTTVPWRRTDVKDAVSRLRQGLSVDDQTLLILRVDRQMAWREIASILGRVQEPALRKRFERIKHELRSLLRGSGGSRAAPDGPITRAGARRPGR